VKIRINYYQNFGSICEDEMLGDRVK